MRKLVSYKPLEIILRQAQDDFSLRQAQDDFSLDVGIWLAIILLLIGARCSANAQSTPTPRPLVVPSSTLRPSATAVPTATVIPTATAAPPTATPTATSTPTAQPEPPTPTASPTPSGVVACARPVEDYARIQINGESINRRTDLMLDAAARLYDGPGDLKRITQGSYTEAETSSFGTHAGGGAVDISIRDPSDPARILYDEAHDMVMALRRAGFAAWFRDTDDLYPGSPMHIHAIAVGDRELSPVAQEQLSGPHGYFRGMDGLPHEDGPRADPHGGPVLCDWMLELGYRDLR